MLIVVLKTRK